MAERDLHLIEDRMETLYWQNIPAIGPEDILVASLGGAGQSIVGNILLELGYNYADPYNEGISADGSVRAAPEYIGYQSRLAATSRRDSFRPRHRWPRFLKTHFTPRVFSSCTFGGVWLLVRDPRDALFSQYHARISFAARPWRAPATFEEWLIAGQNGDYPAEDTTNYLRVDDWPAYYRSWLAVLDHIGRTAVTRFEDLKMEPVPTMQAALRAFGLDVQESEIARACNESSFEAMRRHEDHIVTTRGTTTDRGRIVREGKVDGWRGWMNPRLATLFSGSELEAVAQRFGYDLSSTSLRAMARPAVRLPGLP